MRESPRGGAKVAFATKNNFAGIVDDWFPRAPKLVLVVRGGPLANCRSIFDALELEMNREF